MSYFVISGDDVEAFDHPDECTEPAAGNAVMEVTEGGESKESSVKINGVSVVTKNVGVLFFPEHAHDYDSENGCHDEQSHLIEPPSDGSVTVNGSSIMVGSDTTTDPVSGGNVTVSTTQNNSVELTEGFGFS